MFSVIIKCAPNYGNAVAIEYSKHLFVTIYVGPKFIYMRPSWS